MDKRKGAVLILSLMVTLVLTILLGTIFLKTINESRLASRYINSIRAFWLAETGIAVVKANPGLVAASGNLGDANYIYSATPQVVPGTNNVYWIVNSTGTVNLPSGGSISRNLSATVKTILLDSSKFPYAIDTTADLVIKGAVTINGTPKESDNTINFTNMFGIPKETMKASANHLYTDSNFDAPVDHITWVDVASGSTMNMAGNLTGSGIMVINGNVKISGTITFDGIIYVIGTLTITGTVTTNGTVVAESSAEADTTIKGTVNINYSLQQVEDALLNVQLLNKQIVSWQEI